jgi:aminodeoxyfutalosine synthase
MTAATSWTDIEAAIEAGRGLTRAEAERVAAATDLVTVGMLGESGRRAVRGNRVTYGRVLTLADGAPVPDTWTAGEVRLVGSFTTAYALVARVKAVVAGTMPVTVSSVTELAGLVGHDHMALVDLARALKSAGLFGVAEASIDELGEDLEYAAELIRAIRHGGLELRRATVMRAAFAERLDLIERAAALQKATSAFRAFAPLPRHDPRTEPSTGYDDVRTIAVARLVCRNIESIQVDWPLYGPKLAQVAIAYGADDIDGVAAVEDPAAGSRRSPREEIERHVRMAFAEPAERTGRYEPIA